MSSAEKRVLDRLYLRCALALVVVLAAFLLRQGLTHYFGLRLPPFIFFYPAVMLSALRKLITQSPPPMQLKGSHDTRRS